MMLAKRRWIIRAFSIMGLSRLRTAQLCHQRSVSARGARNDRGRTPSWLPSKPKLALFQIAVAQSGKLLAVVRFHPGGMTQPVITSAREAVVSGGFQLLVLAAADQIDGFR